MPIVTTLGQRCTVFLDADGVQRFKIDSSIDSVLAGDLPIFGPTPFTSNIFVHKIINPADPKADTFLRVGNVADLTTLDLGRETAAGLNHSLYLSTEFSVTYDDIATASTAKVLIQQRVDNLIADWHTYNEQFLAPPTVPPDYSVIDMPLTTSIVSERQDAYTDAHAEYLASKVGSAEATSDAAITAAAAVAANEDAIAAVAASQQCSTMLGHFNGGNTAVNVYRVAVDNFIAASVVWEAAVVVYRAIAGTPSAPERATLDAAKAVYDAALAAMNAAVIAEATNGEAVLEAFRTEMATACTAKIADVAIASQKKRDADAAAATAATAKRAADQTQSTALLADTAAFMALLEVCPDAERITP
jgi:hypothetical protein